MNTQYPLLQNPHFGNISPYRSGSNNFEKIIWDFFSRDFTIVTGDGNTNYIILFIFSKLSTQTQFSTSGLLIAIGKLIRNAYLGIVKHDWTSIVCERASRKHFLSARGNIWNSKVMFYNKTTCLLRGRCFNRNLELLLLFSIISPCWQISVDKYHDHFLFYLSFLSCFSYFYHNLSLCEIFFTNHYFLDFDMLSYSRNHLDIRKYQ